MLRSLPAGDMMTKCIIDINDKGEYHIEVTGHCENGRICTGISALVAGITGWCDNFDRDFRYKEADGYCEITASPLSKDAVMMFLIGISRMELMYPELVKVTTNIT